MFMFHSYKWVFCLVIEKLTIWKYGPKFVFSLLFLYFPVYQMVKFFSLLHGFGSDLLCQLFACPHNCIWLNWVMVCVMCFGLEYGTFELTLVWLVIVSSVPVVGRDLPSETGEHPKIYQMKLWATNEGRAKLKFWWMNFIWRTPTEG